MEFWNKLVWYQFMPQKQASLWWEVSGPSVWISESCGTLRVDEGMRHVPLPIAQPQHPGHLAAWTSQKQAGWGTLKLHLLMPSLTMGVTADWWIGRAAKRAEDAEIQVEKEEVICNLDETAKVRGFKWKLSSNMGVERTLADPSSRRAKRERTRLSPTENQDQHRAQAGRSGLSPSVTYTPATRVSLIKAGQH